MPKIVTSLHPGAPSASASAPSADSLASGAVAPSGATRVLAA